MRRKAPLEESYRGYEDLIDPPPNARPARHQRRAGGRRWSCGCWALVIVATVVTLILLYWQSTGDPVIVEGLPGTATITTTPTALPSLSPTHSPTASWTPIPTATPTRLPSNTPLPTDTATASQTPAPTDTATRFPTLTLTPTPSPIGVADTGLSEGFELYKQVAGIPAGVMLEDVGCRADQSTFVLRFDHAMQPALAYLEVTLAADTESDRFGETILLMPNRFVISQPIVLELNDRSLSLLGYDNPTDLQNAFARLWNQEAPNGIRYLAVTWFATGAQPNLGFRVRALHPGDGGIRIRVRWQINADDPVSEDVGGFVVC